MCQERTLSEKTFGRWRQENSGMEIWVSMKLREVELENAEPKPMADPMLDRRMLKDPNSEVRGVPRRSDILDPVSVNRMSSHIVSSRSVPMRRILD